MPESWRHRRFICSRPTGRLSGDWEFSKINPRFRDVIVATLCQGNPVCYIAATTRINAQIAYANGGDFNQILKRGVDLSVAIESREVAGKTIYSIGYGVLFACLDEGISKEQVEEIGQTIVEWYRKLAPSSGTHIFFRDSAFSDDVSKTNMAAILEQNGITHVRSL